MDHWVYHQSTELALNLSASSGNSGQSTCGTPMHGMMMAYSLNFAIGVILDRIFM